MMNKGPLVGVRIRPGRFVRMYKADAMATSSIPNRIGEGKRRKEVLENKAVLPEEDKSLILASSPSPQMTERKVDDFTTIPGIGSSMAAYLHDLGLLTFEELRDADLSEVRENVRRVIEAWRETAGLAEC